MTFQRVFVFEMHVTLFELCDLFACALGLSERQTIKEGTVGYGWPQAWSTVVLVEGRV